MPKVFSPLALSLNLALALSFASALPSLATDPPVIMPGTGTYSSVQPTVTISGEVGANFLYTQDGSTPTLSSTPYTGPFSIGENATIKAIADLAGLQSTVTTANIQSDPSSLPVPRTGLSLWLKSEFGPLLSGSNVTQWNDLSGSAPANDATQATSTKQPTLIADSINGYPSVNFNSTSQYLNLASGLNNLSTGVSIFAVVAPTSASSARTLFTNGASGVTDMVSLQRSGTTFKANFNNGATASSVTTASGALTNNKFQLVDVVHDGALSASINVNAVSIQSGSAENLNTVSRTVNYIGANSTLASNGYWSGKLAELLVYSRGVTVKERADIESYLLSKYQVLPIATTPTPVISLATSTITAPAQVAISSIPNAITYVTLDGTVPNPATSPVYSAPFLVSHTLIVKALAVANGISSTIATSTITLNSAKWPAPSLTDTTPLQINLQLPTTAIPP